MELLRGGTSFTVDTLRDLSEAKDDLYLILGSDSFVDLETWRAFEEIVSLAALLVIPRPGVDETETRTKAPALLTEALLPSGEACPEDAGRRLPLASFVRTDPVEISSTDIRTRVREGRRIGGLVPAPVETYIRRQGLYGATVHA